MGSQLSSYPDLSGLAGRDLLSSADLSAAETSALIQLASDLKAGRCQVDLGGKVLGLIFSKASTRTRVSFTVAMARLGGQTIDLNPQVTQVGRGEPVADTARVLSRYVDALAIRTFAQAELEEYAHWASIPIVNALTDLEHPCQALADYQTLQEAFGQLAGLTLAYVGDGNNVAHSLLLSGALLGVNVRIGCPRGFEPIRELVEQARALAPAGCSIEVLHDPIAAVRGAPFHKIDRQTAPLPAHGFADHLDGQITDPVRPGADGVVGLEIIDERGPCAAGERLALSHSLPLLGRRKKVPVAEGGGRVR